MLSNQQESDGKMSQPLVGLVEKQVVAIPLRICYALSKTQGAVGKKRKER